MSVYRNRCGKFELELTSPSPMWAKLYEAEDQEHLDMFRFIHATSADLYDLKHLIDRAIAAAEAEEHRRERLHRRP